jgi:hypothetical protein
MCKQKGRSFCSELGEDSSLWSKDAPLPKPTWITDSFQTFSESLELIREEKLIEAKSLLKSAPDLEMREWFSVHAQNSGFWRNKAFGIPAPVPIIPLDANPKFEKFESPLFARDNFRCRYCSSAVLPKKAFKQVNSILGPEAFPLGETNATRSGFYAMFVATLDHVLPWSLGGRTDETNLVTCCWSCNYGKANFTVEQLGLNDPRSH